MATNRYMTPLKYKNGENKERTTKLYFELSPVELADWVMENPFDANELQASMIEMKEIHEEESRDLTRDEINTMMGVVKLLAKISAGRPTEDGEYFLKDENWVHSYAYRQFRIFLFTNPNEMNQFLSTLLDNEVMTEFNATLEASNAKAAAQAQKSGSGKSVDEMSEAELREAFRNRVSAKVESEVIDGEVISESLDTPNA